MLFRSILSFDVGLTPSNATLRTSTATYRTGAIATVATTKPHSVTNGNTTTGALRVSLTFYTKRSVVTRTGGRARERPHGLGGRPTATTQPSATLPLREGLAALRRLEEQVKQDGVGCLPGVTLRCSNICMGDGAVPETAGVSFVGVLLALAEAASRARAWWLGGYGGGETRGGRGASKAAQIGRAHV